MEEDADDLDNLFDEYDSNDPQPQENNNEDAENDAAVPEKVPVPKRVVKHPRLKFNPERLCGKRGIPILEDHFKDVKFKGKGHEKEDLKKLLTTLELWTHRLFPSMKFEDCLRQIEHLGKKRPVKTCLQKIRLDFPILDKDFVRNEDEEEEEQEQPNELEPEPPVQDAFDRLFDDYRERAEPVLTSIPSSSQNEGNILGTSFGSSISEEQKKRMEYNKMLAIERRKARLSTMQSNSLDTESSTNVETVLNSSLSGRRDDDDPNFLFNYLQKQFTNTESSSADKETEKGYSQSMQSKNRQVSERDEMVESVESDRHETDFGILSNVTNNDCTKDNGKEELGLDELMDLVDEDNKDGTDHDTSSAKNQDEIDHDTSSNNCADNNGKEELGLDELMDLVDEDNKDGTDHDASSAKNQDEIDHDTSSNNCPDNNGKEELGLDELMDLVNEDNKDGTDHDTPYVKDKDEIDHDASSNNCPDDNSKEELGFDELMDVVNEDNKDGTDYNTSCEKDKVEIDHDTLCEKDKDEIDHDASSNNCLDGHGKEELEVDELMDSVDENNKSGSDNDTLSCAKNTDEINHNAMSNVRSTDCPESISKKEQELDELMDLVEENHKDTTDDDVLLPLENAVFDSDNYEQSSKKSETNVRDCNDITKETDAEL